MLHSFTEKLLGKNKKNKRGGGGELKPLSAPLTKGIS